MIACINLRDCLNLVLRITKVKINQKKMRYNIDYQFFKRIMFCNFMGVKHIEKHDNLFKQPHR